MSKENETSAERKRNKSYVMKKSKEYAEAIAARIDNEEDKATIIRALSLSEEETPNANPAASRRRPVGTNMKRWVPENDEERAAISQILNELLTEYRKPAAETDEEVAQRFSDYYDRCAEEGRTPVWEEACLSTGYTVATLDAWATGEQPGLSYLSRDLVKKARAFQQAFDAKLVVNGKMNFLAYCFRSKCYYGMRDNAPLPVAPRNPLGNSYVSEKQLEERYMQGLNAPEYEDKTVGRGRKRKQDSDETLSADE